jgi:hypothetical protein
VGAFECPCVVHYEGEHISNAHLDLPIATPYNAGSLLSHVILALPRPAWLNTNRANLCTRDWGRALHPAILEVEPAWPQTGSVSQSVPATRRDSPCQRGLGVLGEDDRAVMVAVQAAITAAVMVAQAQGTRTRFQEGRPLQRVWFSHWQPTRCGRSEPIVMHRDAVRGLPSAQQQLRSQSRNGGTCFMIVFTKRSSISKTEFAGVRSVSDC